MVKLLLALGIAIGSLSSPALANVIVILGPEAEFLGGVMVDGKMCSRFDPDCIWNPYSNYGSSWGESIFNDYSIYGSRYGERSVCNLNISYASSPVLYIIDGGRVNFYDVIGPDSETLLGLNLYHLACD